MGYIPIKNLEIKEDYDFLFSQMIFIVTNLALMVNVSRTAKKLHYTLITKINVGIVKSR